MRRCHPQRRQAASRVLVVSQLRRFPASFRDAPYLLRGREARIVERFETGVVEEDRGTVGRPGRELVDGRIGGEPLDDPVHDRIVVAQGRHVDIDVPVRIRRRERQLGAVRRPGEMAVLLLPHGGVAGIDELAAPRSDLDDRGIAFGIAAAAHAEGQRVRVGGGCPRTSAGSATHVSTTMCSTIST